MCFEILASVYVLTFYDEAKSGEEDDTGFLDRKKIYVDWQGRMKLVMNLSGCL